MKIQWTYQVILLWPPLKNWPIRNIYFASRDGNRTHQNTFRSCDSNFVRKTIEIERTKISNSQIEGRLLRFKKSLVMSWCLSVRTLVRSAVLLQENRLFSIRMAPSITSRTSSENSARYDVILFILLYCSSKAQWRLTVLYNWTMHAFPCFNYLVTDDTSRMKNNRFSWNRTALRTNVRTDKITT